MFYFIKGIVHSIQKNAIVLIAHNIGYLIFVPNADKYVVGNEYLIYTLEIIKEDNHFLVGFESEEQKKLYLQLTKVKGLGPKTAINILSSSDVNSIKKAINDGDISFLRKIDSIGKKMAELIIFELKGELHFSSMSENKNDAIEALIILGYSKTAASKALQNAPSHIQKTEDLVKYALGKLKWYVWKWTKY